MLQEVKFLGLGCANVILELAENAQQFLRFALVVSFRKLLNVYDEFQDQDN